MSLPSIIILIQMGLILVVSVVAGGGRPLRTLPESEWFWVALFGVVLVLEVADIVLWDHTLSGQMQWYVREHKLSGFFVIFWGWLGFHFILEPVVRMVRGFLGGR